jgi:hypothetical protein
LGALPNPSDVVPSKNCTEPVGLIPVTPVTGAEKVTAAPALGDVGETDKTTLGVACRTVVAAVCGVKQVKLLSAGVHCAWNDAVPACVVGKVNVPVTVPFEPASVCVMGKTPVMPEGVTMMLTFGVPNPEADATVTVGETVAPRATEAGALMVNSAASGCTVKPKILLVLDA